MDEMIVLLKKLEAGQKRIESVQVQTNNKLQLLQANQELIIEMITNANVLRTERNSRSRVRSRKMISSPSDLEDVAPALSKKDIESLENEVNKIIEQDEKDKESKEPSKAPSGGARNSKSLEINDARILDCLILDDSSDSDHVDPNIAGPSSRKRSKTRLKSG